MENKITFIQSTQLAKVDYPYASTVPAGMNLLFLAGSCPLDLDGKVPYIDNYEKQAKLCVDNMKQVLKESGAALTNIVSTRVLVATQNQSDLVTVWRTIREEFGDYNVPSTLTGVTVLGYPNQLVEIEAVAAVETK
ncbi:RidA family protein [Bacillus sp. BGMRC 2118]|nr:RidA family protein [Bacillus sp. BGMRC 2118]